MSKLAVVVLVILAIGYLANRYLADGGDRPPTGALGENQSAIEADASSDEPSTTSGAESDETEKSSVGAAESAAAEVVAGPELNAAGADQLADASAVDKQPVSASIAQQKVALGGDDLVDGIPGEGELTRQQIDDWLADPANHAILEPQLPLGLAAGAGEIQGLDENPLTRAKIELGRQLYFDPRLSSDNTISCASCHAPEFGFAFNSQFGIGVDGQEGNRNSPPAYNRILSGAQFWDGRAASLEEQAVGPIANPIEMGNTHEASVATLKTVPGYVRQFEAIFDDGVNIDNVAKAIASFERVLVSGPTPWDRYQELKSFQEAWQIDEEYLDDFKEEDPELYEQYLALKKASDDQPLSESALRGGELFFSDKSGCTACHVGANFTDEKYHNLGVGMDAEQPDLGRFVVTGKDEDRGAFKTPTVRNVADTAPYMHDGSQETLEEVVEWYAKGGHPNQWLSKDVRKLDLSEQDQKDLVEFMKQGLAGKFPNIEPGRLPIDPAG